MTIDFVRPRLALVASALPDGPAGREALSRALGGGDVATVFIGAAGRGEGAFQDFAQGLVPLVQEAGAAAIVADDTRCAGRVKADGLHVSGGSQEELREAIARFSPKLIVGGSGFKTRHDALEAGEALPDYLFFGRLSGETDPAPRDRDVELAAWWAQIVEIPCVLMGGSDLGTLMAAASTGVEFVALSDAVFGSPGAEGERVSAANAVFDELARSRAA
ncbi:thiamine phosphate synthase [Aureimonas populi]|uniref:Thiamine phosphate synthase n=1 Tax=Aureimonas populi TaxID=1701758 RepID=A0ABW5CHV2_9HYPH|nr:thiamine phosphate synthase [Aureimonas populi]